MEAKSTTGAVPRYAETPLKSRPKPPDGSVERVKSLFQKGDCDGEPFESLVLRIDDAMHNVVGNVKKYKYLILAKLVEDLKLKVAVDGDDTEARFVERAGKFLDTQEAEVWLRNCFYKKPAPRPVAAAAIGPSVAHSSAPSVGPSKASSRPSSSNQGRARDSTPAAQANGASSQAQSKQRSFPRVGGSEWSSLLATSTAETDFLSPLDRSPAMLHPLAATTSHMRRYSDSGIRPASNRLTGICASCGQPPQAHAVNGAVFLAQQHIVRHDVVHRVVHRYSALDIGSRIVIIVLLLSFFLVMTGAPKPA